MDSGGEARFRKCTGWREREEKTAALITRRNNLNLKPSLLGSNPEMFFPWDSQNIFGNRVPMCLDTRPLIQLARNKLESWYHANDVKISQSVRVMEEGNRRTPLVKL